MCGARCLTKNLCITGQGTRQSRPSRGDLRGRYMSSGKQSGGARQNTLSLVLAPSCGSCRSAVGTQHVRGLCTDSCWIKHSAHLPHGAQTQTSAWQSPRRKQNAKALPCSNCHAGRRRLSFSHGCPAQNNQKRIMLEKYVTQETLILSASLLEHVDPP